MRSRKLRVAIGTASTVLVVFGIAALPNAVADHCTVTARLPTVQTETLTENVPSSSQVTAPPGASIVGVSCAAPPPPPPPPPSSTSTTTTGSSSPSNGPSGSQGG